MTNSKAFNLILSPEEQGLLTACKQALFTRNSSYAFRYLLHNWEKNFTQSILKRGLCCRR